MNESGHKIRVDYLLDRWGLLLRQQSSETKCCKDESHIIWVIDEHEKFLKIRMLQNISELDKITLKIIR